jgi:hypothetical protein
MARPSWPPSPTRYPSPGASRQRAYLPWTAPTFLTIKDHVAKKPNYEFEKRKKEQERKQKQEAKLQRREEEARQRAQDIANGVVPAEDVV